MFAFDKDTVSSPSPGPAPGRRGRRAIPDLAQSIPDEDGICITIPEGCVGELRCTFKAGCDCMGVIYGRPNSDEVHVIGNCRDGTQTGDQAEHRFICGPWKLWVYNKTKTRFEKIMQKSVHLPDGCDSLILGATHRVSETNKTCIVCIMDVVPNHKKNPRPA